MAAEREGAVDVVGVVGAEFMGSGIAESAARAGVGVHLYEPDEGPLERSRTRLAESVSRGVAGGKLTREEGAEMLGRVNFTSRLEDLAPAQVVVEAIVEDSEAKSTVFAALDKALPETAVIASNTSSIPIAPRHLDRDDRERALLRRADRQDADPDQGPLRLHRQHAARPLPDGGSDDV